VPVRRPPSHRRIARALYGLSRYTIAWSTPNVRATSATASPAAIRSIASLSWCADSFFGRPKRTPRALSRSRPSPAPGSDRRSPDSDGGAQIDRAEEPRHPVSRGDRRPRGTLPLGSGTHARSRSGGFFACARRTVRRMSQRSAITSTRTDRCLPRARGRTRPDVANPPIRIHVAADGGRPLH
jgi:hypothetical protein